MFAFACVQERFFRTHEQCTCRLAFWLGACAGIEGNMQASCRSCARKKDGKGCNLSNHRHRRYSNRGSCCVLEPVHMQGNIFCLGPWLARLRVHQVVLSLLADIHAFLLPSLQTHARNWHAEGAGCRGPVRRAAQTSYVDSTRSLALHDIFFPTSSSEDTDVLKKVLAVFRCTPVPSVPALTMSTQCSVHRSLIACRGRERGYCRRSLCKEQLQTRLKVCTILPFKV